MANNTLDLDFEIPGYDKKPKGPSKKFNKIFLIASAGVLVVALAVAAVLLLAGGTQKTISIIDFNTAVKGVSVGGTDISNMTREQAIAATAQLETNMLAAAKISLSVNGQIYEFEPSALSITTNYTDIINQAMNYGHTGTFDERKAATETPKNFDIKLLLDENALNTALANLKTVLDKTPKEAGFQFMPWGYSLNPDGTPVAYEPDINKMISDASKRKKITYPDNLVRLTPEELPPAIRYQYYKNTAYSKETYIPEAATIARFYYSPEVTGLVADTAAIAGDIKAQVESGSFSMITVPVQVTEPTAKIDEIKQQTHLITSWTSSYSKHNSSSRVWNVAKMSGIICGQIYEPGKKWSINAVAGARTKSRGWKEADGIVDGGYQKQAGGGVCQISSTLYNATIRCGLTGANIESKHHTIISGYIPKGLDATISTGSPDLKVTNPYSTPLYVVSFINPETQSVTVQIYGAPVIDSATGAEVIYHFDSNVLGSYGAAPVDIYYYNKTQLPDGTAIDPGDERRYASKQRGKKIQTYRHFLSLDGKKYKKEDFEYVIIRPINGSIYCNYPESGPETSPETSPT